MEITRLISLALKNANHHVNKGQADALNKAIDLDLTEIVQRQIVIVPIPDKEFEKNRGLEAERINSGQEQGIESASIKGLVDIETATDHVDNKVLVQANPVIKEHINIADEIKVLKTVQLLALKHPQIPIRLVLAL